MKKSDRERRTDASTCKMMPACFEPGPYEVLIGRGRRCTTHWGNQRFRRMVRAELDAYCAATDCKRSKSVIIGRVLGDIQKHSPHAGFVKKDVGTGRWLSLTAAATRVAIAQAFRDALEDTYRSSKHSKQVKRRVQKKVQQSGPRDSQEKLEKEDEKDTYNLDPLPFRQQSSNDDMISAVEFGTLFADFTQDVNMEDNPFEPIPIAVAPPPEPLRQESSPGPRNTKEKSTANKNFGINTPFRDVRVAKTA